MKVAVVYAASRRNTAWKVFARWLVPGCSTSPSPVRAERFRLSQEAHSASGNGLFPANSWLKTFPWDTGQKILFR